MHIENDILLLHTRAQGGEMTGLLYKPDQISLLWDGNNEVWPWHAPNLFPIVGGCFENTIFIEGQKYPMDRHGFLRNQNCILEKSSKDSICWKLSSNEDTLKKYPYHFDFYTTYSLFNHTVNIAFSVVNKGDNPMYFSLGAHPAFILPGEGNYVIEFEKPEKSKRHLLNEKGLFSGLTKSVDFKNKFLLLDPIMFQEDAIVFKDLSSKEATLIRPKSPVKIKLSFTQFKEFGIWTKPGKVHFICLEPWLGYADHAEALVPFLQKEGILMLEAFSTFEASYSIEVVK